MMESIHLSGAEDVRRAASMMHDAATEMLRAVACLDHTLAQQREFMNDWLSRLGETLGPLQR